MVRVLGWVVCCCPYRSVELCSLCRHPLGAELGLEVVEFPRPLLEELLLLSPVALQLRLHQRAFLGVGSW